MVVMKVERFKFNKVFEPSGPSVGLLLPMSLSCMWCPSIARGACHSTKHPDFSKREK